MSKKYLAVFTLAILMLAGVAGVSASSSDSGNVKILAANAPVWEQANISGFGDPTTVEVTALQAFNGYLYAGTYNAIDPALLFDGAQIFRSVDGTTWTPVTQPGFGNSHDIAPPAILDFHVFNNQLYAGTGRGNASQIWRSSNGTIWAPMDVTGFGNPDNVDVTVLTSYNGMIYAGVTNSVTGAQVWRSFTGDNNSWTQVAPSTPGTEASRITGFAEFDGGLYAAVESEFPVQIWQSFGGAWTAVVTDGFGSNNTRMSGGMAVLGGYLYVGAGNISTGAQLWRTNDGAVWEQAISPGFGDPNNLKTEAVFVFQNQLYVGVKNAVTGIEVWRTADGTAWEQVNPDGFGDNKNTTTNRSNAFENFLGGLYVGTSNIVDGGELWRMTQPVIDTETPTSTNTSTPTNTATNTPTDTPTSTPTNTATDTPTSTQTSTATVTSTDTPTDTSTPTNTATNTPTNTATTTPTNTPTATQTSNTPGKVTGGGVIGPKKGKAASTFAFTIKLANGETAPQGNLVFVDHNAKLRLFATSFDTLVIDGNLAWFSGTATMNGNPNVRIEVMVMDSKKSGAHGKSDVFVIRIPSLNFEGGGTLLGGNITIHK